ncbi:MAG: hypothetical protein ACRDIB_00160, partial [Ardenticatenaceae bacterium]
MDAEQNGAGAENKLTVSQQLGDSIIYEELRGDFAAARRLAEEELGRAEATGDNTVIADALLARGGVHLLQGEPLAALASFAEAERLVPGDSARLLLAAGFSNLAVFTHYNRFPNGSGANATEISARWQGVEYLTAEFPRWQALLGQPTPGNVQFLAWLAHEFLCNLYPARSFLESSRHTPGSTAEQLLASALQNVALLQQIVTAAGAPPSVHAYGDLSTADLYKRAGDLTQAETYRQRAQQRYERANDLIGSAVCRMMQGDWLAAPFSGPAVWDFSIQDSGSAGSDLSWTVEADEFNEAGRDPERARAAYEVAERLFRQANAPRGLAALRLRFGYLAMLADDWAGAIEHVVESQRAFDAAGDRLGGWLAAAHSALARIGAGQWPEDQETAIAIGAWGTSEGSFSFVLGIGLLFGRVGRHWLLRR